MDRRHPVADGEGDVEETGGQSGDGATDADDAGLSMADAWRPEDVPEMLPARDEAGELGPLEYAAAVRDAAALDADAAADHVDRLVGIAREVDGDPRDVAVEALDLIGRRSPAALSVRTADLRSLAADPDPVAAGAGLRALARLAADAPGAAAAGVDAALEAITATDARRRPALRLVGAVGESDPDRVAGADRGVAAAMADADPETRTAGVLCAASLLAAAPGTFPRTANALIERLDDPDPDVRDHARVALVPFARDHPAAVPEKRTAIESLGAASDRDLGLPDGATKDALTALLETVHGYAF